MFFVYAKANMMLEDWTATQGWERVARMFGLSLVAYTKPDGFYFIMQCKCFLF